MFLNLFGGKRQSRRRNNKSRKASKRKSRRRNRSRKGGLFGNNKGYAKFDEENSKTFVPPGQVYSAHTPMSPHGGKRKSRRNRRSNRRR